MPEAETPFGASGGSALTDEAHQEVEPGNLETLGNRSPDVTRHKMLKETEMKKYFEYLDGLRESGVTNMFGARPYLMDTFGLGREEASRVLSAWMNTFSEEPVEVRVAKAVTK